MHNKLYFLLGFTLTLTFSGLAGGYFSSKIHDQEVGELIASQNLILTQNVIQAEHLLKERLSDISYITDQLQRNKPWSNDAAITILRDYCNNYTSTYQARIINHLGYELVRVQRNPGARQCTDTPEEALQNKSRRAYYWQSMALPIGGYFVSSLELNMERGEIELPHKPVIRFARKILNPTDNTPLIVIININALDDLGELLRPQDAIEGTANFILDALGGVVSDDGMLAGGAPAEALSSTPSPHTHNESFFRIINNPKSLNKEKGIFLHQLVSMPTNHKIHTLGSEVKHRMPWTFVRWISPEVIASQSPLSPKNMPYIITAWTLASGFIAWLLTSRRKNIIALKASEHNYKLASTIDPLTNLPNRRKLDAELESEYQRFVRHKHPLSILMIDVDDFKSINDEFGHDYGDKTLQKLAELLKANIRETDHMGRYGGEEFLVVCPNTKIQQACLLAEKLRASCEAAPIPGVGVVTLSIGVSEAQAGDTRGVTAPLKRADEALYEAKRNGKNRVEVRRFASLEKASKYGTQPL